MSSPNLFISYRRDDTQWIARSLHRYLSERLGTHRVFMDRVEIRGGDDWRARIDDALGDSTVVLAIIGRHWLTLTDDNHRLRIDREDDWVRQEIRAAFSDGKRLIPLYVDDAPRIARPDALPGDLRRMLDIQSISLTKDGWERDLLELMNRLQSYGFQLHTVSIPMPERRKRVDALTKEMLYRVPEDFPGWSVVTTYAALGPRETPVPRTELYRELRFASFRAATRFMFEASERIDNGNHHPRWENIWTTVRVWLSTWDIEFQPSSFDLQLAQLIEDEYGKFVAK